MTASVNVALIGSKLIGRAHSNGGLSGAGRGESVFAPPDFADALKKHCVLHAVIASARTMLRSTSRTSEPREGLR